VVLVGGWAPGGASNPTAAGALAYFSWLNARGGVYGRAISYQVLDNHGNPRISPSLAHRLVQGDGVFAVFGTTGTPDDPVVRFLDQLAVPDVFTSSDCQCANLPAQAQVLFGWPVDEPREGKILGAWVTQHYAAKKVAIISAPDQADRSGETAFISLSHGIKVADKVAISNAAGAGTAIASVKAAHSSVVVSFAPPALTTSLSAAMKSAGLTVPLVATGAGLAEGLPDGTITDGFLPTTAAQKNSPAAGWISLFSKIRAAELPRAQLSPAVIAGMSAAYEFATAMFRAGPNLTRPGLIAALNGLPPGPAAAPLGLSGGDHGGVSGAYVGVVKGGALMPMSGVLVTDGTASGPVTSAVYPQQTAPADGIPPR
jgi:ABC-type branched-subunit amino acid transport system substrate-binding protein